MMHSLLLTTRHRGASPQCLMDLQLWLPGQARMTPPLLPCPRRARVDLPRDLLHPGDHHLPRPDPPWQSLARNHLERPLLQKALQTSQLSSLRSKPQTKTSLGEYTDKDPSSIQSRWTSNFEDNISDAFGSKSEPTSDPFGGKARYS